MSWFTEHHRPFPNVEYGILHVLATEKPRTRDLAKAMDMKLNQVGAWLSCLKRRELVQLDAMKPWKKFYRLTSLGRQRLDYLEKSSLAEKQTTLSSGLPAKGYPKSPSKRPMISSARAAGGRRKQTTHVRTIGAAAAHK